MKHEVATRRAVGGCSTVHGLFLLVVVPFLLCALGCGGPSFEELRAGIASRGHYIGGVPFVKQHDDDCGPAALAAVFAYWKRPVDLATISAAVYLPALHGTFPMDLERYARESGFLTSSPKGSLKELKAEVRRDRPVICLLDLGFSVYKQPHYVAVIGFDDAAGLFIMHDGGQANRTMSAQDLEKAWSRAGHWMLVVTPKGNE
jgi:ABC-type bacteriocin/lantibiotic exporter with double-glycine peptidase domain